MQKIQSQQSPISGGPSPSKVISSSCPTKVTSKRNFPETLFDLLNTGVNDDILKWTAGGTAFIIIDRKRFTNETLPLYFKGTQYKSFIRKLNRWNFNRITHGPHAGAYQHAFFKMADRSLCRLMSCSSSNTKCNRRNELKTGIPTYDTTDPLILSMKNWLSPCPGAASRSSVNDALQKYIMLEREKVLLKRKTVLVEAQLKLAAGIIPPNATSPSQGQSQGQSQDLHLLLSRSSCYRDATRQGKPKSILKKRTVPTSQRRQNVLQQMEKHHQDLKIEKKTRLLMMKAEEVKLLSDIKYLLAMMKQAKLRIITQQSRAA